MKKLLYLGLLSVCVLLGSCVEKNVSNVFDKVERYMDVYPDSALLLLEQIPHPEEKRIVTKSVNCYSLLKYNQDNLKV